jgi:peptidoglycan/xylan/chitin deacetylase (PgdA/CDA1 family)
MIDEWLSFRVQDVPSVSRLTWTEGVQFRVPRAILHRLGLTPHLTPDGHLVAPPLCAEKVPEASESLRLYATFPAHKPVSSRLPVSYYTVPASFRRLIASAIGRWQRRHIDRWAAFPRWPLDLSADFVADVSGCEPSPFASGPIPVVLTHDLDSAEGLRNVVRWFLDREEAVGARSTNFIVPCAWPIDHGLLSELKHRGHEVGIHGYDHSNRTPFAPTAERQARLQGAHELIERYRIIGYRAPSLLRTRELLHDLVSLYCYDSSIPTSGGLFPVPNNGCASARPFVVEGIAELPLSMPRDGSLRFLGYTPASILDVWMQCANDIARSGGVVVLLTHCESGFSGNPAMLKVYDQFLDFIASSPGFKWSTPRQVLNLALGMGCHE